MGNDRLPTSLWIEAALKPLADRGIYHYINNRGDPGSGLILLKLSNLEGQCKLLTLQRNFETDALEWASALENELVAEKDADAYSARAVDIDPDLWVIEIEDRDMSNPFEE